MQSKYFNSFLSLLLFLAACSDKKDAIIATDTQPEFSFNKDTVFIREKDTTNINGTDNGKLSIYFKAVSHQLNFQLSDSSGKVHFSYRGEIVSNGQPIPVGDSIAVFCYCDTVGVYPIQCALSDQLGRVTERKLFIHCWANQPAKADFIITPLAVTELQSWPYRFDGSVSQKTGGVIRVYHYSINGQPINTNTPVMNWNFHAVGTHTIGLYVTDDLGQNSDTLVKQISIQ